MAYIGNQAQSSFTSFDKQTLTGDGTTGPYTLSHAVANEQEIEVFVNFVRQRPGDAYTTSGDQLTMTGNVASTDDFYVVFQGKALQTVVPPAGSVTDSMITGLSSSKLTGALPAVDGSALTGVTKSNPSLIINGAMTIDQRNGGSSVTPTSTSYTIDRWKATIAASSKISVQQSSTAPAGFYGSVLITSLAATTVGASDYYLFQQQIEGQNMAHLNWGTSDAQSVTLSFWVRSSLTGTFGGSLGNNAFNYTHPFEYTISAADTWEKKEITISGPTSGTWLSTNGVGIQLMIGLGSGSTYSGTAGSWAAAGYQTATGATQLVATSGATFYLTGVKLEAGNTATDFENEDYGTTLRKCQRYYYQVGGSNAYEGVMVATWWSTTALGGTFYYPVEMRAGPSVSMTGVLSNLGGGGTVGSTISSGGQANTRNMQLSWTGASGGTAGKAGIIRANNDLTMRVKFDAEL